MSIEKLDDIEPHFRDKKRVSNLLNRECLDGNSLFACVDYLIFTLLFFHRKGMVYELG